MDVMTLPLGGSYGPLSFRTHAIQAGQKTRNSAPPNAPKPGTAYFEKDLDDVHARVVDHTLHENRFDRDKVTTQGIRLDFSEEATAHNRDWVAQRNASFGYASPWLDKAAIAANDWLKLPSTKLREKAELEADHYLTHALNTMANQLQSSNFRVNSASVAQTPVRVAQHLEAYFNNVDPRIRQAALGEVDPDNKQEYRQKIFDFVDSRMKTSPAFREANRNFDAALRKLEVENRFFVTGAANDRQLLQKQYTDLGVKVPEGAAFNLLGRNPRAFVAAASEPGNPPMDISKYRVTAYSSYGSQEHQPTVATNGRTNLPGVGIEDGTSISAPRLAGTLDDMSLIYPDITPAEAREFLESTAINTAAPPEAEGKGMLNWADALWKATQAQQRKYPAQSPDSERPAQPWGDPNTIRRQYF